MESFRSLTVLEWCAILFAAAVVVIIFFRVKAMERRISFALESLCLSMSIAERGLLSFHRRMARALASIAAQTDPLITELAGLRVANMTDELEQLGNGEVIFSGTETWHAAYQKLLITLKVRSYLSVAWVRNAGYWDDTPGRQSMQLNMELAQRGFRIERIHILPDVLWPAGQRQPIPIILSRLQEQHAHDIIVSVVRERDLANEPDLVSDFAIYGDRATGRQELDEHSRTQQFCLSFDEQSRRQAMARWERLALYAVPFDQVAD